jgi:hypothetical protein
MNKTIILAIVLLTFTNCKPKKIYIENTKIERDSIYLTKTIKEVQRFTDTLTIEHPCDSLGNLKPFTHKVSTKQGNITIQNKNGSINATIDLKAYKEILEKEYQSKLKENTKVTEKTIYKTPFKYWVYLILSLLLNITFIYLIFNKK